MEEQKLITINEAADILNVSRATVYRMIVRKKLRPQKVNPVHEARGPVRLALSEVLSLLPEGEREAARARLG